MNNWKYTILWIATIVVVFVIKDFFDNEKIEQSQENNFVALNDSIRLYKDKYNREVSEKRSIVFNSDKVLKQNDSLKELIKGMKPEVIVETKFVYRDTGTIKFDTVYNNVYIPFSSKDNFRDISGIVKSDGIHFDSFEIYMKQHIAVGEIKNGLFKRNYYGVRIINENPYVKMTDIKPIIIKPNKKWYDRWWIWGAAGLTCGILIMK